MQQSRYELPAAIVPFAGRIMDSDAHEHTPLNFWSENFGSVTADFVSAIKQSKLGANASKLADDTAITAENVWQLKREQAPGAFDMHRRLEVLDFLGVKRQLMFPGPMGLLAASFYSRAEDPSLFRSIGGDRRGYARKLVNAYNEWCGRISTESNRLRPVAVLIADTPEALRADAERLIAKGVRAFWFPSDTPPAGLSPADRTLDPLWSLLSEADAPALAHTGSDERFFATTVWRKADAFEGWKAGEEFSLDPWTLSNMHIPTQSFLTCMVMGGVFERHPTLRYGACEVTAHWIGPATENMDVWHSHSRIFSQIGGASTLKMRPSEYVKRNVRVSCFDFEDVGRYIDRFGLEEVYCYASDFPHPEGGKDPMGCFVKSLSGHSAETFQKFFVENGELLLPD